MNNELIINASSSEVTLGLLEDKKLVELIRDEGDSNFSVGDLYLGRVKKVMPGLNAAFVDIGYEKTSIALFKIFVLLPQIRTLAPSCVNTVAVALPIPDDPPVTRTTLLLKSFI